jgi:hypothetical protein
MNTFRALAVAAVVCAATSPAVAHHSFAAQYDATKPVEMKGTVTLVEWTNPHARFYVDVKDDKGAMVNWNFELASPNVLVRNGWKRNTLKIGDQVTVNGYLSRIEPTSGPKMAIASAVTSSDGRKLFASPPQEQGR